ncbi:MAG: hypothetical protein IJ128_03290, partial [Firmicutes bacterium]|nr:hypothetical protein [Bacillota bacterium]
MATGRMEFHAQSLMQHTYFSFVLPNDAPMEEVGDPAYYDRDPLNLILLHGLTGTDTDWLYGGGAQQLATQYNLNVFMPTTGNTFYLDHGYLGRNYCTFVGKELPDYLQATFGITMTRENTLIGGLSMGGYGAIHTAMAFPERFSTCIALSSAIHIEYMADAMRGGAEDVLPLEMAQIIFGGPDQLESSETNPKVQYRDLKASGKPLPFIYLACGTEDDLYDANRDFADFLEEEGADYHFEEGPGGHDWSFWTKYMDQGLKQALARRGEGGAAHGSDAEQGAAAHGSDAPAAQPRKSRAAQVYADFQERSSKDDEFNDWAGYREELTDFITENTTLGASLLILGAGKCNDLDLGKLADHAGSITLSDYREETAREAFRRYGLIPSNKLRFVEADYVGITDEDYIEYTEILLKIMQKLADTAGKSLEDIAGEELDKMEDTLERIYQRNADYRVNLAGKSDDQAAGTYDYAIVSGVHSQLNNAFRGLFQYARKDVEDRSGNVRFADDLNKFIFQITRKHTSDLVARFNKALFAAANKGVIYGYEENIIYTPQGARTSVIGTVDGARQAGEMLADR